MRAVTFEDADALLIDDPPNGPVDVTAQLPLDLDGGLTQLEKRTPLGDTLRLRLAFDIHLEGTAINAVRNLFQSWTPDILVLCPFWPGQFDAGGSPRARADYYVLIDDDADPEIKPAADLPFDRPACPLLVGRLAEAVNPKLIDANEASASISFFEKSTLYLTLPAAPGLVADDDGNAVLDDDDNPVYDDDWFFADTGRPVFPFWANWARPPMSGRAEVAYESQQVGEGREPADVFFDQPARRQVQLDFTLEGDEPLALLSLFHRVAAGADAFWVPSGLADARLTADVDPADVSLSVVDATAIGDNRHILLNDGDRRVPLIVDSLGAGLLNLTGPVGEAFDQIFGRVESLILARFAAPKISLRFDHSRLAHAQITFTEVPWEMESVAGETLGTTHGRTAIGASLYLFTIDYGDAQTYYRFTDYERDLTYNGETWFARPLEHGNIHETDNLQRIETTLTGRHFTGSPLALFMPMRLEWPLKIEIYEVTAEGVNALAPATVVTEATRVFAGEVDNVRPKPPMLEAPCSSLGALQDRRIPLELYQRGCNATLFGFRCKLQRADWKWTGEVVSYTEAGGVLILENVARSSGPFVALDEGRFAGGMLIIGSGANAQRRAIVTSSELVGDNIELVIGTPLTSSPAAGAVVTFHPGCPGRYLQDCIGFFNNGPNFRGFHFMPIGSPNEAAGRSSESSGAKK